MVIAKLIPRKQGVGSFRDSVNYNLGLSRKDTDKVEYALALCTCQEYYVFRVKIVSKNSRRGRAFRAIFFI